MNYGKYPRILLCFIPAMFCIEGTKVPSYSDGFRLAMMEVNDTEIVTTGLLRKINKEQSYRSNEGNEKKIDKQTKLEGILYMVKLLEESGAYIQGEFPTNPFRA